MPHPILPHHLEQNIERAVLAALRAGADNADVAHKDSRFGPEMLRRFVRV